MKKILVVVMDLEQGGVSSAAISFCNELASKGNEVYFLNMGERNSVLEQRLSPEIKQVTIEGKGVLWNLQSSVFYRKSIVEKIRLLPYAIIKKVTNRKGKWLPFIFRKTMLKEKFDYAVAFRQCAPCYYFTLNCVKANRKIAFIHGELKFMGDISSWDCYFPQFDGIACVSDAVKNEFIQAYPQNKTLFATVYNTLDIHQIGDLSGQDCEITMDTSKTNFLTVARIENASKKIERIPETCKKLVEYGKTNFHWYIVGNGPDIDEDSKYAEELGVSKYITFCGATDNPYPFYRMASCFVLTSQYESYGIVIKEALLLGLPVIAMEYPALYELLDDGITGYIVEQNVESLCSILIEVLEDTTRLNNLETNIKKQLQSNEQAYIQFVHLCE